MKTKEKPTNQPAKLGRRSTSMGNTEPWTRKRWRKKGTYRGEEGTTPVCLSVICDHWLCMACPEGSEKRWAKHERGRKHESFVTHVWRDVYTYSHTRYVFSCFFFFFLQRGSCAGLHLFSPRAHCDLALHGIHTCHHGRKSPCCMRNTYLCLESHPCENIWAAFHAVPQHQS